MRLLWDFSNHVVHGRISILGVTAPAPTILLGTVMSLMTLTRVPLDYKIGRIARVDGIAAAAFLFTIGMYQVAGYSCANYNTKSLSTTQTTMQFIVIFSNIPISFLILFFGLYLTSSSGSMERVLRELLTVRWGIIKGLISYI